MSLDVMQFSTSAYIADTQHLSLPQHGAYMLILMAMWRAGGWIDDDDAKIARIVKLDYACRWQKIAGPVRALLIAKDGKLTQKRLLADAQAETERLFRLRQNACLGGKAKALKNKETALANGSVLAETDENRLSLLLTDSQVSKDSKKEREVLDSDSASWQGRPRGPSAWAKRKPLPLDWKLPEEWKVWAMAQGFAEVEVLRFADAFAGHYWGNGEGQTDWIWKWRKWVNNEINWKSKGRTDGQGRSGTLSETRGSASAAGRKLIAALRSGEGRGVPGSEGYDHMRLLPQK